LLAENIGDENVFTLDSTLFVFSHGWIDAFAISAADIDLDGDIDLMLSTRGGLANFGGGYLENIGSSDTMNFWGGWDSDNFYYSPVFGLTIDPYSSLDFADLDNDGDPDLLVGHSNGTFIYYEYDETLTISDVKKEYEFSIYPNPVNDIIRINIQADIEQIELFDIQGRTVFIQKSNQKEISVNNLSPGIYIIKLKLVDGTLLSDKIVKE